MGQNNFHYAISLAQTLYDIEGDNDDLEEIGLVAYNFIGKTPDCIEHYQI